MPKPIEIEIPEADDGGYCNTHCKFCEMTMALNFVCIVGRGVRCEGDLMKPGPDCPGPGRHVLVRIEKPTRGKPMPMDFDEDRKSVV